MMNALMNNAVRNVTLGMQNIVCVTKYRWPVCILPRYFTAAGEANKFDKDKLNENKRIADDVSTYVLDRIKKVATWGVKSPITTMKVKELKDINEKVKKTRALHMKIHDTLPHYKKNAFVSCALSAHIARESGYGNCGEMASLGLMHLSEKGWTGRAGMFYVSHSNLTQPSRDVPLGKDNSHAFLIIGLGTNSEAMMNTTTSYGANAVVCDPYSTEKSYPVSEMYSRLHNYCGLNLSTLSPILTKVNPIYDTINLVCSNIFSTNEFLHPFLFCKPTLPHAIKMASHLHAFNLASAREEKLYRMNELLQQVPALLATINRMKMTIALGLKEIEKQLPHNSSTLKQAGQPSHAYEAEVVKKNLMHVQTLAQNLNHMMLCQDNVFTLVSQLERFEKPDSILFDSDTIKKSM